MNQIRTAYNQWAADYDTVINKIRDLEAHGIREMLKEIPFNNCLEVGCGTGKNSEWLATWADEVIAVDFSEEMLLRAREKNIAGNISFIQADITKDWFFAERKFDLVTFSLVLEHIENVASVFEKTNAVLEQGGYVYLGELHPYKQYSGSKARFEHKEGTTIIDCFDHNISEFAGAAQNQGWHLRDLKEYFDEDEKKMPSVLCMLFQK